VTRRPLVTAAVALAASAVSLLALLAPSGPATAQVVAPTAVALPADIGRLPASVKQLVTVA
jgi:hypothetical protein